MGSETETVIQDTRTEFCIGFTSVDTCGVGAKVSF